MIDKETPKSANRRGMARFGAVQALFQMDMTEDTVATVLEHFPQHWIGRKVADEEYLPADID